MTFEARFWSRSGAVLEMDISVNYLLHEGKEYACMILRDIGERKRAEAELRRSHMFLRQVIDTDPNFIFAKGRDGRYVMANRSIADCYGTTVEDLIGKSDADFNRNVEEVEFFREKDLEVLDSLEERFIPQEKVTDAAGNTRWLQTVKRPLMTRGKFIWCWERQPISRSASGWKRYCSNENEIYTPRFKSANGSARICTTVFSNHCMR